MKSLKSKKISIKKSDFESLLDKAVKSVPFSRKKSGKVTSQTSSR